MTYKHLGYIVLLFLALGIGLYCGDRIGYQRAVAQRLWIVNGPPSNTPGVYQEAPYQAVKP